MDKQKALKVIGAAPRDGDRQATTTELWNARGNLLTLYMMIEGEKANYDLP